MKDLKIVRLSTSTEEEKELFSVTYGLIKNGMLGFLVEEPSENYGPDGLRFSIDYLNKIGKYLIMFPVEDMVKYVDQMTKMSVDSKSSEFMDTVLETLERFDITNEESYQAINSTSIGNIAYVMENCNTEIIKDSCERFLNKILEKEINKSLSLLQGLDFSKITGLDTSETIKESTSENVGLLIKELKGLDDSELYQITKIIKELKRAKSKHPIWPKDIIHASAVLSEESGELTKSCLQYVYEEGKLTDVDSEAIQVGAMAIRFLSNIYDYKNNDGELLN